MDSLTELVFAQKFPFLEKAKTIVRNSGLNLESIPEEVLNRAVLMVKAGAQGKDYNPEISSSAELMKNEILAFPVAKIIISKMNSSTALDAFSEMFSKNTFNFLSKEKDEKKLIDFALMLKLKFEPLREKEVFALMKVTDYLKHDFNLSQMKLVNKKVSSGKVLLSKNDFLRIVSQKVFSLLRKSLPVSIESVPKKILLKAKEINSDLEKIYSKQSIPVNFGVIKPEFFSPCMKELYSKLLNGENVPHLGRFAIASFLVQLGMQEKQLIDLFRKTPNFNEKTTSYQIKRLIQKKDDFSSPSCAKIREYGLCNSNCYEKHPIQFYKNKLEELK
jgi:DNA primase large subunit